MLPIGFSKESLINAQNYLVTLVDKNSFISTLEQLDPDLCSQYEQIGISMLGIINYCLYFLDKIKYYEFFLRKSDSKVKANGITKKELYLLEKQTDEYEYYFLVTKKAVQTSLDSLNILILKAENLNEHLLVISPDKNVISRLIKETHKKAINSFFLISANHKVDLRVRLNLLRKKTNDLLDLSSFRREFLVFILLPNLLSLRPVRRKRKFLKKTIKYLNNFFNNSYKRRSLEFSDAYNFLVFDLFDLLIIYFASNKVKQRIMSNNRKIEFESFSDQMIHNYCLKNINILNFNIQSKIDNYCLKLFSKIKEEQIEIFFS